MISRRKSYSLLLKPLAFAVLCGLGGTAEAIQFNWDDAIKGSVDTTLSSAYQVFALGAALLAVSSLVTWRSSANLRPVIVVGVLSR